MTALQQCTEMDKHLSASTTRRSELKLQFGSRDPLPISGKDPLRYHYFAFVDPSGTVVYPKGYHQALFAECAWGGKTMIQHFSSGGTDKRWAEANRVNTLVYIAGPTAGGLSTIAGPQWTLACCRRINSWNNWLRREPECHTTLKKA